jgi:acetyl esterase/lipase
MKFTCVGVVVAGLMAAMPAGAGQQAPQAPQAVQISASVDRDVRFGWVSGLALVMDVYRPTPGNGRGIIVVPGSGWRTGTTYDAPPNTELAARASPAYVDYFLVSGYTVFVPNVRMTPRFSYPDPVLDVQRAARFIRNSAARWGVDPGRLGAFGVSSGGHLASLLGVLDGAGSPSSEDAVEKQSARVQAVATVMGAFDLTQAATGSAAELQGDFIGTPSASESLGDRRRQASPVTHVSGDDAPTLLIHGDADEVVPIAQSQAMEQALVKAGVATKLVVVPGGGHGGEVIEQQRGSFMREVVAWFDQYLGVQR